MGKNEKCVVTLDVGVMVVVVVLMVGICSVIVVHGLSHSMTYGLFLHRDQTCVPCTGRWTLIRIPSLLDFLPHIDHHGALSSIPWIFIGWPCCCC